jgi:hypothetical protein
VKRKREFSKESLISGLEQALFRNSLSKRKSKRDCSGEKADSRRKGFLVGAPPFLSCRKAFFFNSVFISERTPFPTLRGLHAQGTFVATERR